MLNMPKYASETEWSVEFGGLLKKCVADGGSNDCDAADLVCQLGDNHAPAGMGC